MWFGRRRLHQDFWALRDVNLAVEKGETLGIVGPNGCGKSTLLQVLCGILQPTTGRVVRQGRVAALLELGAGFNPEFSGRENVYINGEIMGLRRAQIDKALPSIERFAGIGEFIDRPVKTYSTGMYVRLAFSTAIHVEPDILIVDEALAVGDAVFANRCIRKFEELQDRGRHRDFRLARSRPRQADFESRDFSARRPHAGRGQSRRRHQPLRRNRARTPEVLDEQDRAPLPDSSAEQDSISYSHRHGDREAEIIDVDLLDAKGCPVRAIESGQPARVRMRAEFQSAQPEPMAGMLIRTRTGMEVFGTNSRVEGVAVPPCNSGDRVEIEFAFDCWLAPQEYTLTVAMQHPDGHSHDWLDDAIVFRVLDRGDWPGWRICTPRCKCASSRIVAS